MESVIVITESRLVELIENAVSKFFKPVEAVSQKPRYWSDMDTYDLEEAAEYLCLSKSYLSKLTADGKIPCSKVFGRLKFEKRDLDAWVKSKEEKRGDYSASALMLAKSANRKMKHKPLKS